MRMKLADAVIEVLRIAGKPLHYREITNQILDRGLWETLGKEPWNIVNARISTEIKEKGDESRFVRTDLGIYDINPDLSDKTDSNKSEESPIGKEKEASPLHNLYLEDRVARLETVYDQLATKAELEEINKKVVLALKTILQQISE